MILLLLACAGYDDPSDTPDDTTDTTNTACPTGEVFDGDTCVAEACGVGTWGNLPVDGDTVYVAEGGSGDGSEGDPLGSIQEGVDLAGGQNGGLVAVAAGTYVETIAMSDAHDGVTLAGRCREMVTLDGAQGELAPAIEVKGDGAAPAIGLEGFTATGGTDGGLYVEYATVAAHAIRLEANTRLGMQVSGSMATAELTNTEILGTLPSPDGTLGRGLLVEDGASLSASDLLLEANTHLGLKATGADTDVELVGARVLDTVPVEDEKSGIGVWVEYGAHLTAATSTFEGNAYVGVAASDPGTVVDLTDSFVLDTGASDLGAMSGVFVQYGATLTVLDSTIQGNSNVGVAVLNPDTTVTLVETSVLDTSAGADGSGGYGISVEKSGSLVAEGCIVQRNVGAGVGTSGANSSVILTDTAVLDTLRSRDTSLSLGVYAQGSASMVVRGGEISRTTGPGGYVSQGGTIELDGVALTSNTFSGVLVVAGTAVLTEVVITATATDTEWGGGFGVYANDVFGAGSLTITNSTIGPQPYTAVWLDGDGTYLIEDNDLSGNDPYDLRGIPIHGNAVFAERGVTAWNGSSGLRLSGNHFHDATDVAVLLEGATAELEDNTWADDDAQVWQQHCERTAALDSPDPDWVICPDGNVLTDYDVQFTSLFLRDEAPK